MDLLLRVMALRDVVAALGLLVVACGPKTEPESAADAADETAEGSEPAADGDTGENAEADMPPSSDSEEAPKAAGTPASADEAQKLLQLTLEDPELDGYLKLEEPGRFPLKISGDLPPNLTLVKGAKPVEFVASPDKGAAVLVITALELQGKTATIRYRYDVEGVRGTATLTKTPHGWELSNSRIVQHQERPGEK
jgi:hypothetical protein